MSNEKCSKKQFLKIIDGQDHDKYAHVSSFAIYPNAKYMNDSKVQKKYLAKMNKDYIYKDGDDSTYKDGMKIYNKEFIDNINLGDFAFVGLNSADFKGQSNKCSFQTMHLTSNDSFITRMIEHSSHKDLVKGSFMFDIINNVTATKLPIANHVITLLDKKPDSCFNVNETKFDLNSIPNIDLSKCKNISAKKDKQKYDEYSNQLLQHIIDYDIPAFIYIMTLIKPKFLFCFGHESEHITNLLLDKCSINGQNIKDALGIIDAEYIIHYSMYGKGYTNQDKYNNFEKVLNGFVSSMKK